MCVKTVCTLPFNQSQWRLSRCIVAGHTKFKCNICPQHNAMFELRSGHAPSTHKEGILVLISGHFRCIHGHRKLNFQLHIGHTQALPIPSEITIKER